MSRIHLIVSAALILLTSSTASTSAAPPDTLADYVAKPDASYRWAEKQQGKVAGTQFSELILTSQTWQEVPWKHQLFIIKPRSFDGKSTNALLYITGGNWRDELEQPADEAKLPREANAFALLAEQLRTPIAVLLHVPQQPMFDGLTEDALIAMTFAQFLKTGDSNWPLLLPMVKSAVRAMDAVQDYADKTWSTRITTFSVTGASKRGWTTWLTGAVDQRVKMIAPMVIDMLNMAPQMRHQKQTWGDTSYKIRDYTKLGLDKHLDTPRGMALQSIVDPYSYRGQIKQPKLIILGTNDHYWPLDALNLYWNDLVGPKYILYIPNNRHGLKDIERVYGGIRAMHAHATDGTPLPKLAWNFSQADGKMRLRFSSNPPCKEAVVWLSASSDRDFRDDQWQSVPAKNGGEHFTHEMDVPENGFAAMFGEFVFEDPTSPYYFSTNVKIVSKKDDR